MKCPLCDKSTRAVRTLHAGPSSKVVERVCTDGHRWTYALQLVGPIEKRGDGPHAVASKLARGENPVPKKQHDE